MEKNVLKQHCEMLVIGGSAGSLDVLLEVFPKLKKNLSFAIVVVLHRKNTSDHTLTELLSARTKFPVKEIEDKESIHKSIVYVAPPDYHVLIEKDHRFSLDYSEKVNYSRPSIDVTFESASDIYGPAITCIVLSGANNDGTDGAYIVKKRGGVVIAQQPETAIVSFMPEFVIKSVETDFILTPLELIHYINTMK